MVLEIEVTLCLFRFFSFISYFSVKNKNNSWDFNLIISLKNWFEISLPWAARLD